MKKLSIIAYVLVANMVFAMPGKRVAVAPEVLSVWNNLSASQCNIQNMSWAEKSGSSGIWYGLRKNWGGSGTLASQGGVDDVARSADEPNGNVDLSFDPSLGKSGMCVLNLRIHGDNFSAKGVAKTGKIVAPQQLILNPQYNKKSEDIYYKYKPDSQITRVGAGIVSKQYFGPGTLTIVFKVTEDGAPNPEKPSQIDFSPAFWLYNHLYISTALGGGLGSG